MIIIQSLVNPLGIAIGWTLSSQGSLVVGIFTAISSGLYFDKLKKNNY